MVGRYSLFNYTRVEIPPYLKAGVLSDFQSKLLQSLAVHSAVQYYRYIGMLFWHRLEVKIMSCPSMKVAALLPCSGKKAVPTPPRKP